MAAEHDIASDRDDAVDAVAKLVVDRRSYLDSVHLWARRPFGKHQIDLIKKCCAGKSWAQYQNMSFNPTWRCCLKLHQPRDAIFEYLDDLREEFLINRVDVALDFITRTSNDARTLQEWFGCHFVKGWHGRQRLGNYGDTNYTAKESPDKRRVANKIVTYSDLSSKSDGTSPCCHLEWRCLGVDAVRRAGVQTPWDLVDYQHHKFWEKRMLLQAVDYARLGRALRGKRRRTHKVSTTHGFKYDPDKRAGHLFAHLAQYHDAKDGGTFIRPHGCVMALKDFWRHQGRDPAVIRRCLITLPNTAFLPD